MADDKKKFFDRVKSNEYYVRWGKNAFPYVTAALLLSIFQIVTLAVTKNPWGVSGAFTYWGAWLFRAVGGNVDKWYYFASTGAQATLENGILNHPESWRNFGVISGALAATLIASGFKIKKIKSKKQVVAAVVGGLMMGYGARLALGCNIGAFYSGISSLALSGWVFALSLFIGAIIGSKLLVKYFM